MESKWLKFVKNLYQVFQKGNKFCHFKNSIFQNRNKSWFQIWLEPSQHNKCKFLYENAFPNDQLWLQLRALWEDRQKAWKGFRMFGLWPFSSLQLLDSFMSLRIIAHQVDRTFRSFWRTLLKTCRVVLINDSLHCSLQSEHILLLNWFLCPWSRDEEDVHKKRFKNEYFQVRYIPSLYSDRNLRLCFSLFNAVLRSYQAILILVLRLQKVISCKD